MIGYDRTWEKDEALDLYDMVMEKRKKLEDATKGMVEKDRKKESKLKEKKDSVVWCVFVQPLHFLSIPPDIQTLFI